MAINIPNMITDIPNMVTDIPNMASDFPSMAPDLPDMASDFPDMAPDLPNHRESLFLWDLVSRGGAAFFTDLRAHFNSSVSLDNLKKLGFIDELQEKRVRGGVTWGSKLLKIYLTDRGWEFLEENMSAPLTNVGSTVGFILARLLAKLSYFMGEGQHSLDQVFGTPPPAEPEEPTPEFLLWRLQNLRPKHYMKSGNVRLCVLRQALPEYPKAQLDALLLELHDMGRVALHPFGSPALVTFDDQKAEILVDGDARHYLAFR
jgi:hypothetical protein